MPTFNNVRFITKDHEAALCSSGVAIQDNTLYFSAIDATNEFGSIPDRDNLESQIQRVYEKIRFALKRLYTDFGAVMDETIYVKDVAEFNKLREIRHSIYEGYAPPALTVLGVNELEHPDSLIQVKIVARRPDYTAIDLYR